MSTYTIDEVIAHGVAALRMGNHQEAQQMFEVVLSHDNENVAGWWWLAHVIDDQTKKSKCLEKARQYAVQNDQNLAIYRTLLAQSRTPELSRYQLSPKSKSVGTMCPICTLALEVDTTIVLCPGCQRAHHVECWEDNAYHCGNYACSGSGLINQNSPVAIESAVREKTVSIDDQEIPEESPYQTREQQEAGFMGRLRQHAVQMMAANVMHQIAMQAQAEARRQAQEEWERQRQEVRAREEAQRQMEIVRRTVSAFFAGLIPGGILAVATFQYTHSWPIALCALYLSAISISTVAGHAMMEKERLTSILYWLLPQALAAGILFLAFEQLKSGSGIQPVILSLIGSFLLNRILRISSVYERRVFIVYSILALAGLGILRSIFN